MDSVHAPLYTNTPTTNEHESAENERPSWIHTSLQTVMPFTGASFINYCLLHVNHLLLQFADITDPLLSTTALFF